MSRLSEGFLTLSSLSAFSILVTSSAAAARVNVTTSSRETSAAPEHTRSVMRLVRTEVFPLPAAALTAREIPLASIAFLCDGVQLISPIIGIPPLPENIYL